MSSEPKKLQKTFICASGFNREGKGQCYPLGSKQANKIPKGKQTECSVFPNEKCQDRTEYINRMIKILRKKVDMITNFNEQLKILENGQGVGETDIDKSEPEYILGSESLYKGPIKRR
jgi:hypothetical protein